MTKKAKKNNRVRATNLLPPNIPDWGHADQVVGRIGKLQSRIARLEEAATDRHNKIKEKLQADAKPLLAAIALHTNSLQRFADDRKVDFGKGKSKKLSLGIIGWRVSTSIHTKKVTLDLVKTILPPSVRKACVKVKETIDKNALAGLTDEQLAKIEAWRNRKDVFFAEPNSCDAVDYGRKV